MSNTKQSSVFPAALASSTPAAESPLRVVPTEAPSFAQSFAQKPPKTSAMCIRHDARSAMHSALGFSEMLNEPAFGALTDTQRRSVLHMRAAAQRLFELVEMALEAHDHAPLEGTRLPLVSTLQEVLEDQPFSHVLDEDAPILSVSLEASTFRSALEWLFTAMLPNGTGMVSVYVGCTDLHASVTFSVLDAPSMSTELCNVDAISDVLENRDYLRLKRSELLLARQHITVCVNGELSRARLLVPLAR